MTEQVDLDALEALAKAATPGPWGLDQMGEDEPEVNMWADLFVSTIEPDAGGVHHVVARPEDGHGPTAEFIAAADPSTVLALIAELRQERERADYATRQWDSAEVNVEDLAANLARAREVIEKAQATFQNPKHPQAAALEMSLILATYKAERSMP